MGVESVPTEKARESSPESLLKEAETRFDIEEVQECDELVRLLYEAQAFANGETEMSPPFETEDDPDLGNLSEQIDLTFGEGFLASAGVSRITARPDIVHLNLGKGLYLTQDEYQAWAAENTTVQNFKVRAENFTTLVTTRWLQEQFAIERMPLPIVLYSFSEDDLQDADYLAAIPASARMEVYKFGTVAHETGHHIFNFMIDEDERNAILAICLAAPPLTKYAQKYEKSELYAEEQFCEGIRLLTTNPTHLQEQSEALYQWLKNKFPNIQQLPIQAEKSA